MSFSGSQDTSTDDVEVTTLEDESLATAQEAIPYALTWGTSCIAGRYITPIYGARAEEVKTGGGKGSSKGGGGSSSWNYFGTIACAIGIGPHDEITEVAEDNKTLGSSWPVYRPASGPTLVTIEGRGKLRLQWGTGDQAANALLATYGQHPPFKDITYIVGEDFLFGKERTNAPSWQIVTKRTPVQSAITGPSSQLNADGQANLAAIFAEVVTSNYCLGIPLAKLATAAWQAAADSLHTQQDLFAVSPTITKQTRARSFLEQIGSVAGLFARKDTAGLIELKRWVPPSDTSGLIQITAGDLVEDLELDTSAMDEMPTDYTIEFTDRARQWKRGMERVADLAGMRSETQLTTENISAPEVVIRAQARRRIAEHQRQRRGGAVQGTAVVRRSKGRQVRPGDYFLLDVDPVPDGLSSMLLMRCTRRKFGPTGPVTLTFQSEPNAAPTPYVTPTSVVPVVAEVILPPFTKPRLISFKPYAGEAPAIAVLAARPHPMVSGFDIMYDSQAETGTFPVVGSPTGFGLPVQLQAAVTTGATTVRVKAFAEFSAGKPASLDKWMLTDGYEIGDTEAADDRLVLVLLRRNTTTGDIVQTGNSKAFEVMAISDAALVASDTWDLTVLRGRMGTAALAFDTSSGATFPDAFTYFEGWVIPGSKLGRFSHGEFLSVTKAASAASFRLRPWGLGCSYDPTEAFEAGLQAADAWTTYAYTFPASDLIPRTSEVPIANPVLVNTVAAPSLSPGAGLFATSVDLTVSAQAGATVRYSTTGDVTTASQEWPKVSGAYTTMTLTSTTTLRVRAFIGLELSDQLTLQYTKNTTTSKVATPVISALTPTGLSYSVTMSCPTAGAQIYIATSSDGGSTWTAFTARTTASVLARDGAIQAYATKSGWDQSDTFYQLFMDDPGNN